MRDPYEVLGVSPAADAEEIKKAYRRKTKECHPDLHPNDPTAGERMSEVNAAYDMLQDPAKYAEARRREEAREYARRNAYSGDYQNNGYTYTYTYYDPRTYRQAHDEEYETQNYEFRFSPIFSFGRILRWVFIMNALGWLFRLFGGILLR